MPSSPSKSHNKPSKKSNRSRSKAESKPSGKRHRNALSSPSDQSSPESKHPSKMSVATTNTDTYNPLLETIQQMLQDNYNKLSSVISSASESIKAEVGQRIDKLSAELRGDIDRIDKKVNDLSGSVDTRVESLSNEIKHCREHVNNADDDFIRVLRTSELKMIGLKHEMNENLDEILSKIAAILGFDFGGQQPTIVRVTKWVNSEQVPQTIVIIKFIATHLKEAFYKRYLDYLANKKQITLDLLGIGSAKDRLTIGENLTPHNQKLFAACMALKRDGKIAQVYTSNGLTNIKMKKGENAISIKTQRDLDMVISSMPKQPVNAQSDTQSDTQQTKT